MLMLVTYSCMNYAATWMAASISQLTGQLLITALLVTQYGGKVAIGELIIPVVNFNVSLAFGPLLYYAMERLIRYTVFTNWQRDEELKNWKSLLNLLPIGFVMVKDSQIICANNTIQAILDVDDSTRRISMDGIAPCSGSLTARLIDDDIIKERFHYMLFQPSDGSPTKASLFHLLFEDPALNEAAASGRYTFHADSEATKTLSLMVSMMTFSSGTEAHRVVLVQDVSVFDELEKEKVYAQYQKSFFAMITHELRNPLHGVMGVLEVLKSGLSPELTRLCTIGLNTGKLMMCLVNDILDLSQMEANKFKLRNESFSPLEAAAECRDVMQFQFEEKKLGLHLQADDSIPAIVADKNRYKQIIFNLLGNALKFTKEGYVETSINYNREERKLITIVTDTGAGMTPEEQAKLFQMYTRIEAHSSINPQGSVVLLGM